MYLGCNDLRHNFFLNFFKKTIDIEQQILYLNNMTMIKQYSVITTESDDQGNDLYNVQFFPKSRQGLNDAYKYAFTQSNWTIFFNMEEVDNSDDFDINQVDGDFKTLCTQ
jgi:hypothetical protein